MRELSGDIKLSRPQQIWYLLYNCVRGIAGYFTIFHSHFFSPQMIGETDASLPRKYIDGFLKEQLPVHVPTGKLSILDIGCGSGYIRQILGELGYSGSYTGLDVVREPDFDEYAHSLFETRFIQMPIEEFQESNQYDLVLSNTAFEHIVDDVLAGKKARDAVKARGVEIHIVPALWSLPLYLLHGYRQYSPRRVKKVFSHYSLAYRLGGLFSFITHFFCITLPERLTGRKVIRRQPWYPKLAEWCIRADKFLPFFGTMYVIIRHHE